MEIIFTVAILLTWFFLSGRISRLEKEVQVLRGGAPIAKQAYAPAQTPAGQWAVPEQAAVPASPYATQSEQLSFAPQAPSEPSVGESFIAWVKEDWLLKLGAFIILIGFGWFVGYAFIHNWIGPVGRITIGMIVGVGILGFGWARMRTYARQGAVFFVLGDAVILLTIFAARAMYDFLNPESALAVMFLSTAFVALGSVKYHNKSLAVVSMILAAIVPFLTNAPQSDHVGLFAYLFVVILGAVWVVAITGWRSLTTVGLLIVALYSVPHMTNMVFRFVDPSTLIWFAYAFALLFFITNTAGILKIRDGDIRADAITAAGNGLLLLAWITIVAPAEWRSIIILGWMMLFVVAAFAIFAITKRREPFFVYAGVSIAMLGSATAVELEGAQLTIAYIIESATIPLVAYAVMRDRTIALTLTSLTIIPGFLSLGSIAANWWDNIPFEHFFVLLLMAGVLLLLGVFFMAISNKDNSKAPQVLFIAGSVYAYVLLWLSLHAAMADKGMATMVSLVVYTIVGLIAYGYGRINEKKSIHYYGGILLAFTVGHLLIIDVWDMELAARIVTFFAVGALLMGTAFIGRKKNPIVPQA